jgi:CRISPR-associated endonuclease/helicase Cas3
MKDVYQDVARLDYTAVDKSLEIINNKTITVYVPISINMSLIGESLAAIADNLGIEYNEMISGRNVWRKYCDIIDSQDEDFVLNRIKLNKINALMSQFTFSVFPNSKEAEILRSYGKEDNGYLFLESFSEIYSFENGIDTSTFNSSNFL